MLSRRVIIEVNEDGASECRRRIMQVNEGILGQSWGDPEMPSAIFWVVLKNAAGSSWGQEPSIMSISWASRTQSGAKIPPTSPQDPPKIPPHGQLKKKNLLMFLWKFYVASWWCTPDLMIYLISFPMAGNFQVISKKFPSFPTMVHLNPQDYKSLSAIMQVNEDHASERICFLEGLS